MEEIDCGSFLDNVDDYLDFPPEETSDSPESPPEETSDSPESNDSIEIPSMLPLSAISGSSDSDFSAELSVPREEIAQLEWLSTFVEDSFSGGGMTVTWDLFGLTGRSRPGRARSKRSRPAVVFPRVKKMRLLPEWDPPSPAAMVAVVRKCSHCEITKTPQWRAGPLGPKTLCNACGVRYKSGRLFPEYRPAASPTFVPSLHSNSHKKVVEMRNRIHRRSADVDEFSDEALAE